MYGFSRVLLEFTLDRAAEAMPPRRDPRVCECVAQIRQYIDCSVAGSPATDYSKDLAGSVNRLVVMALQHHEVLIASRLQQITVQLDTLPQPLSKRQA
jgi:hypothetical protein